MRYSAKELTAKTYQYRRRFLEIFTSIGFGHVTSAFSWAEIATVLYNEIMALPDSTSTTSARDQIVVSKGHGVGILFPIFEELGYFTPEKMAEMIRIGGSSEELRKLFYPGFDFYGGSLGIGLGLATGMALGAKMDGKERHIWCIVGDAECYEGSIWEAMNFAGHNKLSNLTTIVDRNSLGCSDFTECMLRLEPLKDKWTSCNWVVEEINGHDIEQIYCALSRAKEEPSAPRCIIANTKKGAGLAYLVDKPLMHGYMPKGPEIDRAFQSLKYVGN